MIDTFPKPSYNWPQSKAGQLLAPVGPRDQQLYKEAVIMPSIAWRFRVVNLRLSGGAS